MCETDPKRSRINQSCDSLDLASETSRHPVVSVLNDIFLFHMSAPTSTFLPGSKLPRHWSRPIALFGVLSLDFDGTTQTSNE